MRKGKRSRAHVPQAQDLSSLKVGDSFTLHGELTQGRLERVGSGSCTVSIDHGLQKVTAGDRTFMAHKRERTEWSRRTRVVKLIPVA